MKKYIAIIQLILIFHFSDLICGNFDLISCKESKYIYSNNFLDKGDNNKSSGRHEVKGYLTYDNAVNTPIANAVIYLVTTKKSIIDSAVTDSKGFYVIKQFNGTYTIKVAIKNKWAGANPKDALLINKYFLNIYTFNNDLRKRASDVNLDRSSNPVDALLIDKRFVKKISVFNAEDWLIDNDKLVIYNADQLFNIKTVCSGDVDGSYIP